MSRCFEFIYRPGRSIHVDQMPARLFVLLREGCILRMVPNHFAQIQLLGCF